MEMNRFPIHGATAKETIDGQPSSMAARFFARPQRQGLNECLLRHWNRSLAVLASAEQVAMLVRAMGTIAQNRCFPGEQARLFNPGGSAWARPAERP
jgi:hypothetical protein